MKNLDAGTVTRLVILLITLLNMTLTISGNNPIPFSEESVGEYISLTFLGISSIVAYWKNNPHTLEAKKANEHMKQLKAERKSQEDSNN